MKTILKNFIHTLLHYKVSSILNVLGLALAFASMYILLVQVHWELTYNHSIKDADRVFAVESKSDFTENKFDHYIARPIMDNLAAAAPFIEAMGTEGDQSEEGTFTFMRGDTKEHFKVDYARVSLSFLDVVGFENVEGEVHDIRKPNTVAIPETIAAKFALNVGDLLDGKLGNKKISCEIVAVYKDFADNTLLNKNPIIADMGNRSIDTHTDWNFCYYVKLKSAADKEKLEALYLKMFKQLAIDEGIEKDVVESLFDTRLVPLKEMYFSDGATTSARGNKNTVYTLLSIAILIVVIALINFVNFFYALIPVRIRKVNTMKIFGSPIYALRLNFIVEALGLVFISLLIAWYFVYMVQESGFADYISTSLFLSDNPFVLIATMISAFLVAIVASIYPAYYITSFPMAFVLKGSFAVSKSGKLLRAMLLGVQFVISITLIVSAIFMRVQNDYMMNYDMGFNKENVFSVWVTGKISGTNSKAFSEKLLVNPQIKAVARAQRGIVADTEMRWGRNVKDQDIKFSCFPVSSDFLKVMGIAVLEGRDFIEADDLKERGTFIFNEAAKKEYNLTLDDKVYGHNGDADIVGFCKDYNFLPLQYGISPMALYVCATPWDYLDHFYIRTEANADVKAVIDYIKTTMVEFDPTIIKEEVDVVFFDEELGKLYTKEERLTTLITLFSVVSIVISLMGVFGLVLFETQYRRKEIGIRRVHGASRREILAMFNRKYIVMVLVCFVVAVPISYYILDKWVSGFAYRASLSWWIFALALLLVLLITIITVTIRSMKAANDDPANSIKTE